MDLEQRIARVEQQLRTSRDREAVWQLMARYAKAVDEEDDVALAAIVSEDVTCETVPWSKGRVFEGRDSFIRLFKGYQRTFVNRKRFITNEIFEFTDENNATGWSNWLVVHARDGESYIGWGSYDWGFSRASGDWLINKFVVHVDRMTTLAQGWADAQSQLAEFPREQKVRPE